VAAAFQRAEPKASPVQQASFDASDFQRTGLVPVHDTAEAGDSELRTHIVTDGDSLSSLADRYLDDPELGDEIYRLNHDVLTSPDLLPIGVELKIPDRRVANIRRAASSPQSAGMPISNAPAGMVPVDERGNSGSGQPQVQLLRPVPAR
jgi:hypothetical protein